MADQNFTIKVTMDQVGFRRATQEGRKYDNTQGKIRGSTAGLRRQVGALRNQLLLVSFAFGGVTVAMKKFLDTTGKFQQAKARFQAMTGSAEEAERIFRILNDTAAETPLTLDDVIEAGASLEAFGASAEAAIDPIVDLAGRMGTTATEAANAFGRAFAGGAGAADIFREKGILQVVKDFKGIEDLSKLTLPEFRVALVETMIDPAAGIAGAGELIAQTWIGATSNLSDSVTRLSDRIGSSLMPAAMSLVKTTTAFVNSIDTEEIKSYATAIGVTLAGAVIFYTTSIIKAAIATKTFSKALIRSGWGLVIIAITSAVGALLDWMNVFEDSTEQFDDNKKSVEEWLEELRSATTTNKELAESIEKSEEALQKKLDLLFATNEEEKLAINLGRELTETETLLVQRIHERKRALELQKKAQEEATKAAKEARDLDLSLLDAQLQLALATMKNSKDHQDQGAALGRVIDLRKQLITAFGDEIDIQVKLNEDLYPQLFANTDGLSEKQMQLHDTILATFNETQKKAPVVVNWANTLSKAMTSAFDPDIHGNQKLGQVMIDLISGLQSVIFATATVQQALTKVFNPLGFAESIAAIALLEAMKAGVRSLMIKEAATGTDFVTSGPQLMLVGENAGGKERVQVTPLSSPNINGPQGGGVTVNISAPMVDETVVDHIIPAIQRASNLNLA